MKKQNYQTQQRQSILAYLAKHGGHHLQAREIHEALQEEGTPIGLATIYRNLAALVDEGLLAKHKNETGSTCYRYLPCANTHSQELHAICSVCGKLYHIEAQVLADAARALEGRYGFLLDPEQTTLYGLCPNCRK